MSLDIGNEEDRRGGSHSRELARLGRIVEDIWPDALRFSLDAEQAAERCGRRACRAAGECRLRHVDGRPLSCGAGISDETIRIASAAALFGGLMVMRVLHSDRAELSAPWRLEGET